MLALLRPWSGKLLADRVTEAQRSFGRCGIVFVLHVLGTQRTGCERRGNESIFVRVA